MIFCPAWRGRLSYKPLPCYGAVYVEAYLHATLVLVIKYCYNILSEATWKILGALKGRQGRVPLHDWEGSSRFDGHSHSPDAWVGSNLWNGPLVQFFGIDFTWHATQGYQHTHISACGSSPKSQVLHSLGGNAMHLRPSLAALCVAIGCVDPKKFAVDWRTVTNVWDLIASNSKLKQCAACWW